MKFAAVFFLMTFGAIKAQAGLAFSFDTSFMQDSKTLTDSPVVRESFYDGAVGVQLWKDSRFYLTMGYLYSSSTEPLSTSTTATFTSNNPYGGFKYVFGNKNNYAFAAYWMPYLQGSYTQSNQDTEVWTGSGGYAKISAQPELGAGVRIVVSVAYYAGNYTVKGSAASVSTVDSFTRAAVIPQIGLQFGY